MVEGNRAGPFLQLFVNLYTECQQSLACKVDFQWGESRDGAGQETGRMFRKAD